MTWHDEILGEIWKTREEMSRPFNHDALAIGKALLKEERKSGWEFRTPPKKQDIDPRMQTG